MLEFVDSEPRANVAECGRLVARFGEPSHFGPGIGRYLQRLILPAPDIPVSLRLVVA
jgi:hypothetical protein